MTENEIRKLDGTCLPTLLLHSCCGPCSSYVLEYLSRFFAITVYYYNPNIRPAEEYEKRLENQEVIIQRMDFPSLRPELIVPEYVPAEFDAVTEGMQDLPEGGERCTECFRLRIGNAARYAAENGFEWFCTTLSVSPHKDAERINRIGQEYAELYGLKWLPSDFKKKDGYKRSVELSEKYGLYRQNYCGCTPNS